MQSGRKSRLKLVFPTEPNEPVADLFKSIIMIYGAKKIGKTDLASQFSKKMLHLMHEPMARQLRTLQVSCPDYEHSAEWMRMLIEEEHDFDSVSIDPLPLVYDWAIEYTGRVQGFTHPGDQKDYGKSWSDVYVNFSRPLMKLLHSDLGVMFHAHEEDEKIPTRNGKEFIIRRPEGAKGVKKFLDANIENVWYYHMRGNKRFLQLRGDDFAFACCAFTENFFTPGGARVAAVPMGDSAKEGFQNLMRAFDNKQTKTYNEKEEETKHKKVKRVLKRKK